MIKFTSNDRRVRVVALALIGIALCGQQPMGETMAQYQTACSQELNSFHSDHDVKHLETITSVLAQQNPKTIPISDTGIRLQLLRSWIQMLVVIDDNIDLAYDKNNPDYRFTMHVPPLSSSQSADPEAQQQYAEKVEANRRKAAKSLFQIRIRAINDKATWIFSGFVIANYSDTSQEAAFINTVNQSALSQERKQTILDIQARKSLR